MNKKIINIMVIAMMVHFLIACSHAAPSPAVTDEAKKSATPTSGPKADDVVDVFVPGADGYSHIRIPSMVTTKQGTLIAFAEGRKGGDHSENDIIAKRSTDGGKTWSKVQVVHDAGALALNNPQPVVLPDSGRVVLIYQRNKQSEHRVKPGFEGDDVGYTLLQYSDDDGKSWSQPRDITRGVKRDAPVTSHASGPGIGIVLRRGKYKNRIIMPFNQGPFNRWKVYAAYSDDGGENWKYGEVAPDDAKGIGNEVQMVELSDGSILLNTRVHGGSGHRKIALSSDGGQSWSPLRDDKALIEPQCQAALIRYSDPLDGQRSRILFANPASQTGRKNGTVRISYDEGKTWPISRPVFEGDFAYCCLALLKDGDVGLLFERGGYKSISFMRLGADWLFAGEGE